MSTKLRVVFSAPAKVAGGRTLNDCLLFQRKRSFSHFTSFQTSYIFEDNKKLYCQIYVKPDECDFQRNISRFSPQTPLQEYILLTVIYGVKSAPYLALKILLQLANDEGNEFPLGPKPFHLYR